jgi:hypothetical protein
LGDDTLDDERHLRFSSTDQKATVLKGKISLGESITTTTTTTTTTSNSENDKEMSHSPLLNTPPLHHYPNVITPPDDHNNNNNNNNNHSNNGNIGFDISTNVNTNEIFNSLKKDNVESILESRDSTLPLFESEDETHPHALLSFTPPDVDNNNNASNEEVAFNLDKTIYQ